MIQRIQSVYLLVAAVFTAIFTFSHLVEIKSGEYLYYITAFGVFDTNSTAEALFSTTFFGLFALALVFLKIFIIFLYKNRAIQIRLSIISIVANLGLIGLIYYLSLNATSQLESVTSYKIPVIFPLVSVVLLVLAILSIRKDDNLVKSLNRIR